MSKENYEEFEAVDIVGSRITLDKLDEIVPEEQSTIYQKFYKAYMEKIGRL